MLTKICGITRLEDAEIAVEYGAGALGFVFWPGSPRHIGLERARSIVSTMPPNVMAVGVFVNQPSDEVNHIAATVGLSAVQLHGDETVGYAETITRTVIKSIALRESGHGSVGDWPLTTLVLLDAHDAQLRGGTGRAIDWERAAAISKQRRIVLAGGLRPENVADAIRSVRPFGIDVASGVEQRPGVKDPGRLKALFEAVREAGTSENGR